MKTRTCGVVLLALLVTVCDGATIYVNGTTGDDAWDGLCETWDGGSCGPKATIQMGIFAALDGDTIIVADGTYSGLLNKDLDFGGLAITLRSINGPESCIIDCEGEGRGFQFRFGEGLDSVVEGFTITNGYVTEEGGGAILCRDGSSPTIKNCIMSENGSLSGGAMRCNGASNPMIVECYFVGNSGDQGGAITVSNSSPTIVGCTLAGNTASYGGGAVSVYDSSSNVTITNSLIVGNSAGGNGGGIYRASAATLNLANCAVIGNSAGAGGGLSIQSSGSAIITNCMVVDNSASDDAGGIQCWYADCSLRNCTIAGNSAIGYGGAIYCHQSDATVVSCVLWGDSAPEGTEIALLNNSSLTVSYSDVEGGWAWPYIEPGCTLDWGAGNIVVDPLFVDPDGPDDDPATWEDNDRHIGAYSLCIDVGDPDFEPGADETDIDGESRVWDGDGDGVAVVDMGADEHGSAALGDLNCDGIIDFFDIDPFVMTMTFPDDYAGVYPDCDIMLADCNQDGLVDFFDIDAFVAIIVEQ